MQQQRGAHARIATLVIQDRLDHPEEGGVEVAVHLADGSTRWCFFYTPQRLSFAGDWVEGTKLRMHLGVNHMIVVAELSEDSIHHVLRDLEANDLLLQHTRPVESRSPDS